MRHLLSPQGQRELRRFASSDVLVAFDFDGTLAPIVADPRLATIRPRTRRLVRALTAVYPCIVISGRARSDLKSKVRSLGFGATIGNHGAEPSLDSKRLRARVRSWSPILQERVSPIAGIHIEDKRFSVSIHYRRSKAKSRARRAILDAVALLEGARIVEGKQVVNVVPRGAPDKGVALCAERDRLRYDRAIYVGDDETDEDVFRLGDAARLMTVRVGFRRNSLAAYYLRGQSAVVSFLEFLVALRPASFRKRKGAPT